MKAHLMYRERDFDLESPPVWNGAALTQDLELTTLVEAMARDDELIGDVARRTLLASDVADIDTILYRQGQLQDALSHPDVLRQLYALTAEALATAHHFGLWGPSSVLYGAVEMMQTFVGILRRLRGVAVEQAGGFGSEGFRALFAVLRSELGDEYLASVEAHLGVLKLRRGVLISAGLGAGNAGSNYVLRQPNEDHRNWLLRWLERDPPGYTFRIPDRDEAGARALSELHDRGIDLVANALGQSADHVASFFKMLRVELAFYVGCLNLRERLEALGAPTSFPRPLAVGESTLRSQELVDACLALQLQHRPVGNSIDATSKRGVVITGANQGGKSSFLRAVGLAQLMMQSGMFVAAETFEADVRTGIVTHYKREEDRALKSGKLDEELARLSELVEHLSPGGLVLFNESFASTNEREGSEIARQVVSALLERGVKVLFVTHLHAFAHGLFERASQRLLFLRAERRADGTRTFRLNPGEPLSTSHARDIYERIFSESSRDPILTTQGAKEARSK